MARVLIPGYRKIETSGSASYDDSAIREQITQLQNSKADKAETTVNILYPTLETSTQNGVTCTDNGDGMYILNGKATGNCEFILSTSIRPDQCQGMRLVGCPKGEGMPGQLVLQCRQYKTSGVSNILDLGGGAILNFSDDVRSIAFIIYVGNGFTVNNLVFKPMLTRNLNATYDDFVSYTGYTGQLNTDLAYIKRNMQAKDNIAYGTMQLTYSDANTLVGTKTLDKTVSAITASLVIKSGSAYKNVNTLAVSAENKTILIQALGMNFASDNTVTVSYIAMM